MRTTTKNVSITRLLIISIMYHTLVFLIYAINHPARLQLHMCIQEFREGQVKLTCRSGYSAVQVHSEMSPSSQISPTSRQCCVLKQNTSKTHSRHCFETSPADPSVEAPRPSAHTAWQPNRPWTGLKITPHEFHVFPKLSGWRGTLHSGMS